MAYQKHSNWRQKQQYSPPRTTAVEAPPLSLGSLVQTISKSDLTEGAQAWHGLAKIEDVCLVASYNWLDAKQPSIVVPGKPARWTPLSKPARLSLDSGDYFRDPNAARFPKHPLEPAVKVALEADPELPAKLDLVACGSTLGNLRRFVADSDKAFRLLVERVGETVFLTRRENSPTQLIPDVFGYGHTFPEAYTTWDPEVKGSASHQRLLRYRFGTLDILVRFQGDGYIPKCQGDDRSASPRDTRQQANSSLEDLLGSLDASNVSPKTPDVTGDLKITKGGQLVPQDQVFELKTRSIKKRDQDVLAGELDKLWITQIPRFIHAYHERGVFTDIQIDEVGGRVRQWETDHQDQLAHLLVLLDRIIAMAACHDGGKLEINCPIGGPLEIREQLPDAGDALSLKLRAAWEGAVPISG